MRVFGLIGHPLTHSFSKHYFEEKFRLLGLTDHVYDLYPMSDLSAFKSWVVGIDGLVGLNVTIPHKRSVLSFLDESKLPDGLPACNCIHVINGKLIGYNTDVIGFSNSLQPMLKPHHTEALVLGHGGAADAIFYVLRKLGITYQVVGRRTGQGIDLTYEQLTPSIIRQHPLIIQTTPLGTYPNLNECPSIPYEGIGADHLLYDLVYNPGKTLFLQKGETAGASIKNGLEMLELQAEAAWSIWNGELPA